MDPPEWVEVDGQQFIMGRAYAYRTPDDGYRHQAGHSHRPRG
jgi:hypothetical protein